MPDQPKTPHSTFRLTDDTRRQLSDIAQAMRVTQTDAVNRSVAAMATAMNSPELRGSLERLAEQARQAMRGFDDIAHRKLAESVAHAASMPSAPPADDHTRHAVDEEGSIVSSSASIDAGTLGTRLCPLGYGHTEHVWELAGKEPVGADLFVCVGQPFQSR